MTLSFIVAASDNNAIGINNELPWRLPEDLKFFKRTTIGKPVIMGRKTYESLGKPLPGRLNIMLSQNKGVQIPEGVVIAHTIQEAVSIASKEATDEIFIIGGGKIFEQALPMADRLYMTRVHTIINNADAFFPDIDHTHWKMVWDEKHNADDRHAFDYTFQKYERIEL